MFSNRKIKKIVKSELDSPPQVDEFCKECGIEFIPAPKSGTKRRWWIPAFTATAASIIIVCGCIPLMLPKKQVNQPIYGKDDIVYISCDISNIYGSNNIKFIDINKMQQYNDVYAIYPTNNSSKCLGYHITDIICGTQENDLLYAFEFDYWVRTYKKFTFLEINSYNDLSEHYSLNYVVYNYVIDDDTAYISYIINDNDYFITLKGYSDITEVNQDSVEFFIENVLGK